ncbi:MAG: ABC transporter permease [Acidobacteria bacterium]|nr:ABC transporter permease [Acidobacteriota bacterium]
MSDTFQDLRYAARTLGRSPGFTATAVLTLALGIGANTAIFSVVNAVLLRPLPYPEPERLVDIMRRYRGFDDNGQSGAEFLFYREHCRSFERLAAFDGVSSGLNLVVGGEAEYVRALGASADYFRVFGAEPARGRSFQEEEDRPDGANVAVLSHALWQRRFNCDPDIVGRAVSLGGRAYTIVGVTPAGFNSIPPADVWTALHPSPRNEDPNFDVVGRLKAGVTLAQAQSEMDAVGEAFRRQSARAQEDRSVPWLRPLQSYLARSVRPALLVILGAVGVVLLIACVNTANLLLVRASSRAREIAIRAALGAGRQRIVRQLLTESVLLALAGGGLGLLVARWSVPGLLALTPAEYSIWQHVGVDGTVLGVTVALSLLTGIVFGLAPALEITRLDLSEAFKAGGGRTTSGRRAGWLRQALVVAEVALCMVLLVGAGLLVRTFMNLRRVNPGLDPHNVLTAQMSLYGDRYRTAEKLAAFYESGLARIRQLPGVEGAAVISNLPIERGLNMPAFLVDGPLAGETRMSDWRYITPDYFRVMKIPLLAGRYLEEADTARSANVAVVNQEFARRYFANGEAIGRHIQTFRGADGERAREIVGIVGDVKERGLDGPARPVMHVPVSQAPDRALGATHYWFQVSWVVRAREGGSGLIADMQQKVRAVDPEQPFSGFRTMEQVMAGSLRQQQFQMMLLGLFAALALALAAAGIYGLISYSVVQRTQEIGIRLALGATAGSLVRAIVWQGTALAGAGVAAGLIAALALTRLLERFVFGVGTADPATFLGVAMLLVAVAAAASLIPALRVVRLNPMDTLRVE